MLQPGINFALTSPEVPNEIYIFPIGKTYYLIDLIEFWLHIMSSVRFDLLALFSFSHTTPKNKFFFNFRRHIIYSNELYLCSHVVLSHKYCERFCKMPASSPGD